MSLNRTREFLLKLPRVEETLQWDNFVYWVGDKAVGGKMFCMLVPEPGESLVASFAATPDRFNDLLEIEGVQPAPYLARAHWVAIDRWDIFPAAEFHAHLQAAYNRVEAKLPTRVQRTLALSDREYRAAIREKRAEAKAKAK